MRGGRRKKERRTSLTLDPGSTAGPPYICTCTSANKLFRLHKENVPIFRKINNFHIRSRFVALILCNTKVLTGLDLEKKKILKF